MSDVTRSSIPSLVPVELLKECFDYDPEPGSLTWRQRPLKHFCDSQTAKIWNTRYAGKSAGSTNSLGYRRVGLTVDGRLFQLYRHRIAWAIMTGAWPETQIDHEDDNRADDRWAKLRPTDNSRRIHATAALVGKGVARHRNRWRAKSVPTGNTFISAVSQPTRPPTRPIWKPRSDLLADDTEAR